MIMMLAMLYFAVGFLIIMVLDIWASVTGRYSEPVVAWFDCWIGLFYDVQRKRLYIFPIPMVGLRIDLRATTGTNSSTGG